MAVMEGKSLAVEIKAYLAARLQAAAKAAGRPPCLAAVAAGRDLASDVYLNKEIENCAKLGVETRVETFGADSGETRRLFDAVKKFSADDSVDAVLVPRPAPEVFEGQFLWELINPDKDIDGASIINAGRLFLCKTAGDIAAMRGFAPCTAAAVMRVLNRYNVEIKGKNAVVIGRSAVVGRPLAHMLSCSDATVTLCHSKTSDIASIIRQADIVVSAIGSARWLKADFIKKDAVVVDVGTSPDESGKLAGDVDYEPVLNIASGITPVPGGVGPVTLACLLENVVTAFERKFLPASRGF